MFRAIEAFRPRLIALYAAPFASDAACADLGFASAGELMKRRRCHGHVGLLLMWKRHGELGCLGSAKKLALPRRGFP